MAGLVLAGSVALTACSGEVLIDSTSTSTGGGGGTTTTPPPTVEEACLAYWDATCTQLATCVAVSAAAAFGDHETCVASMVDNCTSGFNSPGTKPNTAGTLACAGAVANLTCDQWSQQWNGEIDVDGCGPSPGELAIGSACGSSNQCASAVCDVPTDEVCGHCTSGELGTPCDGFDGCKIGLRCLAGTCVALGQIGDACSATAPCNTGVACLDGKCSPPLPAGAPCDTKSYFASPCELGLLCNPETGVCAKYDIASPGSLCGFVNGEIHYCGKGYFCLDNWPDPRVCVPVIADGEPCSQMMANGLGPCDYPSRCVEGICRYPDASACQ